MRRRSNCQWGLLPLAALWLLANLFGTGAAEDDALAQSSTDTETELEAADAFDWSARRDGDAVALSGNVPTEEARANVLAAAENALPDVEIRDEMQVSADAPDGIEGNAIFAVEQLAGLTDGSASLSGDALSLSGTAASDAAYDAAMDAENNLPEGLTMADADIRAPGAVDEGEGEKEGDGEGGEGAEDEDGGGDEAAADTSPVDAETCEGLFAQALEGATLEFDTGQATLKAGGTAVLDELASIAGRCSDASIEVSGHTDNVGNEAFNKDLSQRRAQTIVDYLTQAGIAQENLTAAGYGSSRPVASNDTEEGKARNRRIEITVN